MKLAGICIARNEADLLPVSAAHHLAAGLDELTLVDNGSTDHTPRALARFARDPRVRLLRDDRAFHQAAWTTELIHAARRRGADWVLVFDADEFWHAPAGNFRQVLETSPAGALQVAVLNFVQRRRQRTNHPAALLHLRHRAVPRDLPYAEEAVARGELPFVEAPFPPKWIVRPAADFATGKGMHVVTGVAGPLLATEAIVCLHAPLRSFAQLEQKAANGRRHLEVGVAPGESWQTLRWLGLAGRGGLAAEWAANSEQGGRLGGPGGPTALVRDDRLRDLVRPHLPWPWRWWP